MITIPHLHDLLNGLPADLQEQIYARARQREVPKEHAIYRQGDTPSEWYQVIEGAIRMCTYSSSGRELVTIELHEGDCFGEMGVIDGLPRVSNAIASRKSELRVWSRADFDELTQIPAFNQAVMHMLALRSRLAYCMLIESSGLSLRERLAIALCRLAYSLPEPGEHHEIPISQEVLGQMLGASRQAVNKELQQLASAQLISLNYGKIRVTNLQELVARYGQLVGTDSVAAVYTRN